MSDTDDAPLWAEAIDMVFGPALFVRTLLHIYVAYELSDIEAAAPENDVTLASPVEGLRGHRLDVAARMVTAYAAIAAVWLFPVLPASGMGLAELTITTWLTANCALLWADPLALWVWKLRTEDNMTETKHADGGIDG